MDIDIIAKALGALGLMLIALGVLLKNEKKQDIVFILGSAGLLVYSISLQDPIFIPLEALFILVTGWELWQLMAGRKK